MSAAGETRPLKPLGHDFVRAVEASDPRCSYCYGCTRTPAGDHHCSGKRKCYEPEEAHVPPTPVIGGREEVEGGPRFVAERVYLELKAENARLRDSAITWMKTFEATAARAEKLASENARLEALLKERE